MCLAPSPAGSATRRTAYRLSRLALRRLGGALLLAWLGAGAAASAAADTLVLSLEQGLFEDARVKKALLVGLDWHGLAESGGAKVDDIVLRDGRGDGRVDGRGDSRNNGRRETTLQPGRADPEAARRLLAEAGAGRRQAVPIILFHAPKLEKTAALLQRALKALGFASTPQVFTPQNRDKLIAATRVTTGRQTIELPYILLALEDSAAPAPVEQLADLVVLGAPEVHFDEQNRFLTVVVTVANRGPGDAGPQRIGIADRNRLLRLPPVAIDGLGPRERRSVKTGAELPEDLLGETLILQAAVDIANAVRESDERNNLGEVLRFALPAPERPPETRPEPQPEPQPEPRGFVDLAVLGPPEARFDAARRQLAVRVVVANLGSREAGPHRLSLIDRNGGLRLAPLEIDGLGPREKRDFLFTAEVPEDLLGRSLVLQAVSDSDGQIAESEEGNNRGDALQIDLPAPSPEPVEPLEPVAEAEPMPLPIPRPERPPEPPQTTTEPRPQPAPDPRPEASRLADLALTAFKIVPREDGGASVLFTVTNYGETVSAATDIEVSAEGSGQWQRLPLRTLAPGETVSENWTVTATGDALAVSVSVDPDNRVRESVETNNALRQRIDLTVPPGDGLRGLLPPWAPVALAGLAVLLGLPLVLFILRRTSGKDRLPKAVARIAYRANADPGRVTVERGARDAVTFRLTLRPAADPGSQSVALEAH